ncbi:MAG: S8 family serine peptidase [Candidatus Bathyarchaeia archaeon]
MRKPFSLMLSLTLAFMMILSIFAIEPAAGALDDAELILRFKPGVRGDSGRRLLGALGLSVIDEIPQIRVLVIRVPGKALTQVINALRHNPMIDFVEENRRVLVEAIPNDPYYTKQWHLAKIEAPVAWDISVGSENVVIAILDSGVDPNHPDLAAKLLQGYNFYDNNYNTSDVYGHGTAVAGVAAAITNNGLGVAGIAWQCLILPVRVTDPNGYTTFSLLSKGLVYAADYGAKVATISFRIYGGSALSSAAKYFMDKGGLVVGAGGNTGEYCSDQDNPYIISVSATTSTDTIASWSTYGPYIDLSAPGSSIYTTLRGGGYGSVSGTSFSTPLTAGLIALIFSANPSLTPQQVEQILKTTADDLGEPGYDVYYGWGRINAAKALTAAISAAAPLPDTTPPNVKITYPENGATVSGAITVSVQASDNTAVSKVELYINGTLLAIDTEAPYEFYWDTSSERSGTYMLQAKAYDKAGNIGESDKVTVYITNYATNMVKTVDTNPPVVSILQPQSGATVSRTVDIRVEAKDESGISKVEFYINGKLVATVNAEPYTYRWNTRSVKDGWYTITAKAYDNFGNTAQAGIEVYVSNRK